MRRKSKDSISDLVYGKVIESFVVIHEEFGFYTDKGFYLDFCKDVEYAKFFDSEDKATDCRLGLPAGLRIPSQVRKIQRTITLL